MDEIDILKDRLDLKLINKKNPIQRTTNIPVYPFKACSVSLTSHIL